MEFGGSKIGWKEIRTDWNWMAVELEVDDGGIGWLKLGGIKWIVLSGSGFGIKINWD